VEWRRSPVVRHPGEHRFLREHCSQDGAAYLGGDNTFVAGPRSTVVAFDPSVDPGPLIDGLVDLVRHYLA